MTSLDEARASPRATSLECSSEVSAIWTTASPRSFVELTVARIGGCVEAARGGREADFPAHQRSGALAHLRALCEALVVDARDQEERRVAHFWARGRRLDVGALGA